MKALMQLIPSEICLKCRVCCRFATPESGMFPLFMKEEVASLSPEHQVLFPSPYETGSKATPLRPAAKPYSDADGRKCACPFFNPVTQECAIYPNRPLDCQLYPFVLTTSLTGKRIVLGIDTQCPFVQDLKNRASLVGYGAYVRDYLEEEDAVRAVAGSRDLIREPEATVLSLYPLAGLTEKLCQMSPFGNPPSSLSGLSPLSLNEVPLLERYFSSSPRAFAEEALLPLFAFQDLLHYYWKEKEGVLWIVAEQGGSFFMPVPPVTSLLTSEHLEEALSFLKELNPKGVLPRIEGLPEALLPLVERLGWTVYPKSPEYRYPQEALSALKGDGYKSKRALCNFFTKHYDFTYRPYEPDDFWECLHLFQRWQKGKAGKGADPYEQALLEDAAFIHHRTFLHAESLKGEGRVVTVGGEVKGYTFGYPLDAQTWCIFLEIAEPQVKGLAQFLFREFCREKKEFKWISVMDDSGLERLQRVKESYRPALKKNPYVTHPKV